MTDEEAPMPKAPTERPRVHLYPVEDHYLPGVRHVERIVPADVADVLLAGPHPAFTRERPEGQDEPSPDALEDITDILREVPELRPAAPSTEAPATPALEGQSNG